MLVRPRGSQLRLPAAPPPTASVSMLPQAVWIVVPLSYGILVRHESAGIRKVAGAVCCMVAAIILGLAGEVGGGCECFRSPTPLCVAAAGSGEGGGGDASSGDGGGDPEEGPIWLKLCLFLATVTSWSISDTLSAYVMRCA